MKKALASLIILLIFGFLFVWFVQPKTQSINIANAKTNLTNLETWVGHYSFSESTLPNQMRFYTINIYRENSEYFAKINIDGFQSMKRLLAKVSGDTNSIKLVFFQYLSDNMFQSYKTGDVLLILEKKDSKLITTWGKIIPLLIKNYKPGEYLQLDSSSPNNKRIK